MAAENKKVTSKVDRQEATGPADSPDTNPQSPNGLYYQVIDESLAQFDGIPNLPGHIFFGIQPGADISEEILEIQAAVESTTATLRRLYLDSQPERFRQLFLEVLSAAQLMAGPKPSPLVTANVIARFQQRIASTEGKIKKTRYLNNLGVRIFIVILFLMAIAVVNRSASLSSIINTQVTSAIPYLAVLFGTAAAAMWLSFATRKPRFSFDDLVEPEGDMMGPSHRMTYVLLFTAVLALFAEVEVIGTISIGKFSTDTISGDFLSAAVFGFACGFSEKLLASTVSPHVSKIMAGMGKTQ